MQECLGVCWEVLRPQACQMYDAQGIDPTMDGGGPGMGGGMGGDQSNQRESECHVRLRA